MVHYLAMVLAGVAVLAFAAILLSLVREGMPAITWRFLASTSDGESGGIGMEIVNTAVMTGIALLVTAPLGLLVAIFQKDYAHRESREIGRMHATLLSAPTIVIALVIYRVAVGWWHWPVSVLTGCLVLSVINWPFMAALTSQAIAGVPDSYREASMALGASKFETMTRVVLPAAMGRLIDGWGLAFARLAGESAALIVTAGVNVSHNWSFLGPGETLAVHIWYIRTEGVAVNRDAQAAATGIVLMAFITVVIWLAGRVAHLVGKGGT